MSKNILEFYIEFMTFSKTYTWFLYRIYDSRAFSNFPHGLLTLTLTLPPFPFLPFSRFHTLSYLTLLFVVCWWILGWDGVPTGSGFGYARSLYSWFFFSFLLRGGFCFFCFFPPPPPPSPPSPPPPPPLVPPCSSLLPLFWNFPPYCLCFWIFGWFPFASFWISALRRS